jgi:hypothetical protein
MTSEEILALPPGLELNVAVAKEVLGRPVALDNTFGWMERILSPQDGSSIWSVIEPYSQEMSAAQRIIDHAVKLGFQKADGWPDFGGGKFTRAEAVCKAALLATFEKRHIEEVSNRILKQALGEE